jgi:WD40 repeat protein
LAEPAEKPVSFHSDVTPILKRSCTGCHQPAKKKGDLDLTSFTTLQKGGKHGAEFKPGDPKNSRFIDEISGDEPSMPKEGDPLTKAEVGLIERWIAEGAKDDTPPDSDSFKLKEPPVYQVAPVLSALAFSPDGSLLAVSGYHEVLLHKADGTKLMGRLVGESPRIESVAFSPNGQLLAVSGGAPARFGEVQVWNVASNSLVHAFKISIDSLYGVCFSPDAERVAFGCADKTVRIIRVADGKELLKFDNHSDWVLATTFTLDGRRLLSGSRDRAMKLIDATSGQFIDDINKLLEGVLCFARHPKLDEVVYGGDLGGVRIYKMAENQERTAANNDVNMLREFERQPGPVRAVAFDTDGTLVAVGGVMPEVRIYKASDGSRVASLKGQEGGIFTLAFHPKSNQIVTGGYDGTVRLYEPTSGKLISSFIPVPLKTGDQLATARVTPPAN